MRALAPSLLVLVLLHPARAEAQLSTGIAADHFVPAVGPVALLGTEGAEVTPFGKMTWATSLGYVRDPIRLTNDFNGTLASRPVRGQLTLDGGVEAGVWKRLAVGIGVPFRVWATGDRLRGISEDTRTLARAQAGDLRLRIKASFVGDPARRGLHLAAVVQLTVPLGGQNDFAATDGVTGEPRLVADVRYGRFFAAAQLGVRFQSDRTLFGTQLGDALVWQAGAAVQALDHGLFRGGVLAEFAGEVGPSAGTYPAEFRGGVRLSYATAALDLAAGVGLDHDVGAPSWRILAVVRHEFALR